MLTDLPPLAGIRASVPVDRFERADALPFWVAVLTTPAEIVVLGAWRDRHVAYETLRRTMVARLADLKMGRPTTDQHPTKTGGQYFRINVIYESGSDAVIEGLLEPVTVR